jgi:putative transposase
VVVAQPNQVWSTDGTSVRLRRGCLYLVAILDWYRRYVLAWEVFNTLATGCCLEALERALAQSTPERFNTDQGTQFTSQAFTARLAPAASRISWDGRGQALDTVLVERLWRSVQYEEGYLHDDETTSEAIYQLGSYFRFDNQERLHQALA